MKVLKSKYHGSQWDKKDVVILPVNELWASVPKAEHYKGKDFYGPVMEDIKENGLQFPLLIVDATRAQVLEQKEKHKDKLVDLPFESDSDLTLRQYVVWGGSNRIRIAEELGYTHIDCVVYANGDFATPHHKQGLHRTPYKKKFY
tara:strand:+ start:296 stop:730 length:435 start_codon:yes stop_codon:yes gene_type:complete